MLEIRDDHPETLPESILKIFERDWEFKLPSGYREFLLKHNGGTPNLDCFTFENEPDNGSIIQCFFGIYPDHNYDLIETIKTYKVRENRLPKRLFPIANDCGGNLICISVMNPDRGKIYFWDHEQETDPPDDSNLTLIANSFEDFLDGLHEAPKLD